MLYPYFQIKNQLQFTSSPVSSAKAKGVHSFTLMPPYALMIQNLSTMDNLS